MQFITNALLLAALAAVLFSGAIEAHCSGRQCGKK